MLGKDVAFSGATGVEDARPMGDILLDFSQYGRKRSVHPFNLTIHKGEVIGVYMTKQAEWFLDEYNGFAGGKRL